MVKQNFKLKVEANGKWTSLQAFSENTDIDENVQVLHCDTRDFHIIGSSEKPKVYKKPNIIMNIGATRVFPNCTTCFQNQTGKTTQ